MASPRSPARDRVTVPVLLVLAALVGLGVVLRVRFLGDEMMTRWRTVLEGGALRRFFTPRHWLVEESSDGRQGLAAIRAGPAHVDLVISGLRMPGLSGIELHDLRLAEEPELLRRFVFSTGDVASADAASFVQRTSCPVLQKPFELRMLDDSIIAQARGATAEHMIL